MRREIDLSVSHPTRRVPFVPLRRLLEHVARLEGVDIESLSVVLADHRLVLDLNQRHLERDYITDVIAFDLRQTPGVGPLDGEIYVDLDTAAERAPEFGVRFTDEVWRYAVHGLLHLAGHRDDTESGRQAMRELEDRYLKTVRPG